MADESQFMNDFIRQNPVPRETIEYFASVPWINEYLQDPAYETIPTFSRTMKPSGEDYFFSKTINTPITIPHYLTLQLRDLKTPPKSDSSRSSSEIVIRHKEVTVVPETPDCIFLLNIGEKGMDGHPGVVHGGMVCAILDETMGLLIMLHHNNVTGKGPRDRLFTANLNVSYRAPVPSSSDLLIRTWLLKREERKWYSKGQIVDKNGNVLSEAEGLWVMTRSKL